MPASALSPYDEEILRALQVWKSPPSSRLGRVLDRVEAAVDRGLSKVPAKQLNAVLERVVPLVGDATWRATSTPLVLRAYRRAGTPVGSVSAIESLELEVVDAVAGSKRVQEGLAGATEGAGLGFFGLPAIPADIAAVMLLSIRAAQSRSLVYGFDPRAPDELDFALQVVDGAARLGPQSKASARAGLAGASRIMAQRQVLPRSTAWALERVPALAARLTVLKSDNAAPVIGAITGGAFNAWYLQAVAQTARMAYRERFLDRRYGSDLLAAYAV